MNKQPFKVMIAITIFITSILLTGCSWNYVYRNQTNIHTNTNTLKREDAKEFTVKKTSVEPITKIDIRTSLAEIKLLPADDYYVEINYTYWEEAPKYELNDGILSFDDSKAFPTSYSINFKLDNTVNIYLPEDALIDNISLISATGNIVGNGFQTDSLNIKVSYGNLSIQDALAKKANINLSSGSSEFTNFATEQLVYNNSYGNAKFTNINTSDFKLSDLVSPDTFNLSMSSGAVTIKGMIIPSIKLNNSYGNITCKEVYAEDLNVNLSSGNLDVSKSELKDANISNSYGNVTLSLEGKQEDYSFNLNTTYGKINIGNKKYDDHVNLDYGSYGKISAGLSSGDIKIDFSN